MTATAAIVDYDCGNLFSIARAVEHCGGRVALATLPEEIAAADRLILPGVGAFGTAMKALAERGLTDAVKAFVATGRPFLGICVGMQAMMDYSEEFGRRDGLGFIAGHVVPIPATSADGRPHPVPHIGWSDLEEPGAAWGNTVFKGLQSGTPAYFVHSFNAVPERPEHRLATCDYGGRTITAAVIKDNMTGCQFHPEKSGAAGLRIIGNFLDS